MVRKMKVGKRALLYLVRKKSKSITLLIVLTIISTLILMGVTIGNATDAAIDNLYESLGGYFKIEMNIQSGMPGKVTDALVADIMESEKISAYNGMDLLYLVVDDLELEPGRYTQSGEGGADITRFLGNTDSSLNEYFTLGLLSLQEGRHIQAGDSGKAVISNALAERNHLSVGDTFSASYSGEGLMEEEQNRIVPHELEVVGIYQVETVSHKDNSNTAECDIVENFIFTDTACLRSIPEEIDGREIDTYKRGVVFYVSNPRDLDAIVNSLTEMDGYNWEGYTITENNEAYQENAVPLVRLSGFISTLVFAILLISAVILSLILFLWMKDRIHEIGVFLSIGIRKTSIIGQHILENLLVAFIAFVLACIIVISTGSQIEKRIDTVLSESTETVETTGNSSMDTQSAEQLFVKQGLEADSSVDIHIGVVELIEILGIEVLIVILSTGISSIIVLRMRPRDILSSMS